MAIIGRRLMVSAGSSKSSRGSLPEVGGEVCSDIFTYKLIGVLGEGGFGTVFECRQGRRMCAVKVEKYRKSMLHVEASVMITAERHNCKHICPLIDHGTKKPDYVFVVMPLLGKDLHTLRHEQLDRRFSLSTSILAGMQTLAAIEELHRCGFISRDIKPGNFAIGRNENHQHRTIFLLDFGLAKRYSDAEGKHYPSRGEVGWRGTTRYGSLKAHQRLDLGRRDDLESWFYLLVEITGGGLPWRRVSERGIVQASKLMARREGRAHFLHDCPKQYDDLLTIIDALVFQDEPQYQLIQAILSNIRKENGIDELSRFDWEQEDSSAYFNATESSSAETLSSIDESDTFNVVNSI